MTIINQKPAEPVILKTEVGYTIVKQLFGTVYDYDLSKVGGWSRLASQPKSTAVYVEEPFNIDKKIFTWSNLTDSTAYTVTLGFLDNFILGNSTLLQAQYLQAEQVADLIDTNVTTKTPITITNIVNQVTDNVVANPFSDLVFTIVGEADVLLIQAKLTSDSEWSTIYEDKPKDTLVLQLPGGEYNIRYVSTIGFSDGTQESYPQKTYPSVVSVESGLSAPVEVTGLSLSAIKTSSMATTYDLHVSWVYPQDQANQNKKRNFTVTIMPNPSGTTNYASLNWDSASEEVSINSPYVIRPFPYRAKYVVRVGVMGWGVTASDYVYLPVYVTREASESGVLGYLVPSEVPAPSNTKIQVDDQYIRGYSVYDASTPENNRLMFELDANTGNVIIGRAGGAYNNTNITTAPFIFDSVNNKLQVSGRVITDQIESASYVMTWIDADTPSFRTAGKTGYGANAPGIWMGYTNLTTFKFDLGDASKYIRWDGSELTISGTVRIGNDGRTVGQSQKQVFIYKRSPTPITTAPTGGTFVSPAPAGWSTVSPAGTDPLYMCFRLFTSDAMPPQESGWSLPSEFLAGTPGADGSSFNLIASAQAVTFDEFGVQSPANQTITFSVSKQNVTGSTTWTTTDDAGVTINVLTGVSDTSASLPGSAFAARKSIKVTASAGGKTDYITVVKLQNGSSAVVGVLTNESHTVPSDKDGVVSSFAGAGGSFKVYRGSTDITNTCAFTVASSVSLTGTINATTGVYSATAMSADTGIITLRAAPPTGAALEKIFTVTKSKAGITGGRGAGQYSAPYVNPTAVITNAMALAAKNACPNDTPVSGDIVTLYDSSPAIKPVSMLFSGSGDGTLAAHWQTFTVRIDGNLLVTGTVGADKINVNELFAQNATVSGQLQVGSGNTFTLIDGVGGGLSSFYGGTTIFSSTPLGGYLNGKFLGLGTVSKSSLSPELQQWIAEQGNGGNSFEFGGSAAFAGNPLASGTFTMVPTINCAAGQATINFSYGGKSKTVISATNPGAAWITLQFKRNNVAMHSGVFIFNGTVQELSTNEWFCELPNINFTQEFNVPQGPSDFSVVISHSFPSGGSSAPLGAFNAGAFQQPSGAGVVNMDLDDLVDVQITSATNGQVLTFNTSTGKWVNGAASGGGTTGTLTFGSGLNTGTFNGSASTTVSVNHTSSNTGGAIVSRDGSGNFSAGTITATLNGVASSANAVAWNNVSSKPSTFTPSAHTHDFSNVSVGSTTIFNGPLSLISSLTSSGYNLYPNSEFEDLSTDDPGQSVVSQLNGMRVYNNGTDGGAVSIQRLTNQSTAPNTTRAVIQISTTSTTVPGAVGPGRGGFYVDTFSRANAIFVSRIKAKIPIGYTLEWASNPTGTNGYSMWLTPNAGTGKWEEYAFIVQCGNTGTFSPTNYFYLQGSGAVTWQVAHLSVWDITRTDLNSNYKFEGARGRATHPTYRFANDINTGMWSSAPDTINFSANGVQRLKIDINGALFTDVITCPDVIATSDIRVKTNLQKITDPVDRLKKLKGGFTFNRSDMGGKLQAGIIANYLKEALPEAVTEGDDGLLRVSSSGLLGLLVEVCTEQQKRIEELERKWQQSM